ncbi:MAG TPA: fumarylacetoacetate hydrolase family protein [Burkholderiaceae bacterium]|nr:fumarylacetoacetate hydrolase family protein [Burkholderiaceae bacterium]
MKLVTINAGSSGHPGVLLGDAEVIDLIALRRISRLALMLPDSVRGILDAGDEGLALVRRCLAEVEGMTAGELDRLHEGGLLAPLQGTPLLAPVPNPRLILAASGNYARHLKEYPDVSLPKYPTAFVKTRDSLIGHGQPIVLPEQFPDKVDFEGEMCFVFGRTCHNVDEASAMDFVAGYTIANDVSARDWVPEVFTSNERFESIRTWERNIMGKNLPTFTPCGPVLTTRDEIRDPHDLAITTRLNGKVMQSSSTSDQVSGIATLISYFSKWYRFQPGDIVTTGTPEGVGAGRTPPVFMRAGDQIEVEIAGLGKLSNRVTGSR